MANINITNIKKPENLTNIKLKHFIVKVINNNKTLSIKAIKKIITNILKEFVINEIKIYYIKLNVSGVGEVKSNNGFNVWLDFFEYDNKGNLNFTLDDSIYLK